MSCNLEGCRESQKKSQSGRGLDDGNQAIHIVIHMHLKSYLRNRSLPEAWRLEKKNLRAIEELYIEIVVSPKPGDQISL